ncbi:MAG: glucoamylase family protein [Terriglobia bacterium]
MTIHDRPGRGRYGPRPGHHLHRAIPLLFCVAALLQPVRLAASQGLSRNDRAFLEELSYRCFLFFWEQADPHTGLVPDRALVVGLPETGSVRNIANVAATGFGLTAVCVGAKHGWITKEQARQRILLTLGFLANRAPEVHGWYYHWMDKTTGQRIMRSEISSIDTSLLLAGVLTAREAFPHDREIVRLATFIYDRVDFTWMLNGSPILLSHGWVPGAGFLTHRWDAYCEAMILYLLAIGSPTHPIPPSSWYAWRRPLVHFEGYTFVGDLPLFTQQYAEAWVDFRGLRDAPPSNVDYFQNSIAATQANRAFCLRFSKTFPKSYSANVWGVTASDSPHRYTVWGEPSDFAVIDGTVVPCAPGGSLMFAPSICLAALEAMRAKFGKEIYSRYGFADAFNPTEGWVDRDVIGIDVGITLLSAENLLDHEIWRWFMRDNNIQRAMFRARLRPEGRFVGTFKRYYQYYEARQPF